MESDRGNTHLECTLPILRDTDQWSRSAPSTILLGIPEARRSMLPPAPLGHSSQAKRVVARNSLRMGSAVVDTLHAPWSMYAGSMLPAPGYALSAITSQDAWSADPRRACTHKTLQLFTCTIVTRLRLSHISVQCSLMALMVRARAAWRARARLPTCCGQGEVGGLAKELVEREAQSDADECAPKRSANTSRPTSS